MALSENGGHPGGQFGEDSNSVASIRATLLDQLQASWKTFGRLDLVTESPAKRKAVGKLRDRLSDLMNELEGIR